MIKEKQTNRFSLFLSKLHLLSHIFPLYHSSFTHMIKPAFIGPTLLAWKPYARHTYLCQAHCWKFIVRGYASFTVSYCVSGNSKITFYLTNELVYCLKQTSVSSNLLLRVGGSRLVQCSNHWQANRLRI